MAAEDGRITVIRTEIRSYGFQVNQGIRIAKGKYIAIVETDDYIDRIMYEQLYGLAEKEQCDYVKGNYTSFWKLVDGEEIFAERKSLAGDELYKGVICPKEYPQAGFGDFYLWTGIYNREFLVDNGIAFSESKGAAYQDIGFLVQTNVKAERVLYLKKSYYYYCADRVGASTNIGRGLQYCYYEFDQMLKWDGYSEKGDWTLLYVRMLQEYYYAINHIDIQAFEDNEEIRQICSWFSEKIQDALKVGLLDYGVFMESQQAKLKLLVRDARQYLQNRQKDIEQYLREIKVCDFWMWIWWPPVIFRYETAGSETTVLC